MLYYAGLDVSMKSTSICIMDEEDKIVLETSCPTEPADLASVLKPYAKSMKIVGIEAGSISFWLVDELRKHELPAVCLDSRQVANILATIINKTDKNDARGIARILRSNFYTVVHQRSKVSLEIGLLMAMRSGLVADRTRKKNRIRGLIKTYGIRFKASGLKLFIDEVRSSITELPETARNTIEIGLKDLANTDAAVEELEQEVREVSKKHEIVALLQTVSGIGPITALTFMAEIDDPTRFKHCPENVGAYLGLTPTQYSSGESVRLGGISKSGSPGLRCLLYEAAVVLLTKTKKWSKLKSWGLRLAKKKPMKVAIAAVARKLAVTMLMMWLTGEIFRFSDPKDEEKQTKTIKSKRNSTIYSKKPNSILAEKSA